MSRNSKLVVTLCWLIVILIVSVQGTFAQSSRWENDRDSFTATANTCMQVALPIDLYDDYKGLLDPGDILFVRGVGDVQYQLAKLKLISLQYAPIRKGIIFASYRELQAHIDDILPYVDIVAYNTERGMTPSAELQDLLNSVEEFVRIAKQRDLDVAWGATEPMLRAMPTLLSDVAVHVDLVGLQHQKALPNLGVDGTVDLTKERSWIIKDSNSVAEVNLQLRGSSDQILEVLYKTADYVDVVFVLAEEGSGFDYGAILRDSVLRGGCGSSPEPQLEWPEDPGIPVVPTVVPVETPVPYSVPAEDWPPSDYRGQEPPWLWQRSYRPWASPLRRNSPRRRLVFPRW